MSPDPKILQISNYIRTEFGTSKIYLFGSRAKGTSKPNSDYDFVAVTPTKKFEKWTAHKKARREIFEQFKVSADVWIYSSDEFDHLLEDFGSMPETALNTGIEV